MYILADLLADPREPSRSRAILAGPRAYKSFIRADPRATFTSNAHVRTCQCICICMYIRSNSNWYQRLYVHDTPLYVIALVYIHAYMQMWMCMHACIMHVCTGMHASCMHAVDECMNAWMYTNACMHVVDECMNVWMYGCMYVCMNVDECMNVWMYECMFVCMCLCICTGNYVYTRF